MWKHYENCKEKYSKMRWKIHDLHVEMKVCRPIGCKIFFGGGIASMM